MNKSFADAINQEKMRNIKLIVTDVDGVLTDCAAYYDEKGLLFKRFHMRDGFGFVLAQNAGLELGVITGDVSEVVKARLAKFKIERVKGGHFRKTGFLQEILDETGFSHEECAYIGDDLFDMPVLKIVGLGVAPADAHEEVKEVVDVITRADGGMGVFRETVEAIIKAQDKWDQVLDLIEKDEKGGLK